MANLRVNKIVSTTGSNAITGSVEFDGNDYLLESTGAGGFNASQGDWTIESWMYCNDASQPDILINAQTTSTDRFYIQFIGQTIYIGDGTSNIIAIGGVKQVNSWFHIAVTKSSSTYRAFINGILIGSSTSGLLNYNLDSLTIGYRGSQGYYTKGFISNLRIVKGTALYTQNFIPPTAELRNVPGTVLLCCQNPSSATQEATGKTITVNGNATARNFAPAVGSDGTVTFDGVTKISTENYFYLPTGNTEDRGRGRGVFTGGLNPGTPTNSINSIDYVSISSAGIAIDFGDLYSGAKRGSGSASSLTRGINGGGLSGPALTNIVEFITISSTSNSQDFGDLTSSRQAVGSASNNTRGLFSGGATPTSVSTIDFITIASLGNASTFGNLSAANSNQSCGLNSPTRGIFAGGTSNVIEFVNFASTGNAQDFGDISAGAIELPGVCSSSTRGILAGGELQPTGTLTNSISFITLASSGNSTNFGELSVSTRQISGTSNSIRGIFGGGLAPTVVNTISFVTIASTGNASDFGDLTQAKSVSSACSDSHGGLG